MDVGNDDSPNCYGTEYQNVTESSIIDYIETVVLHDLQYPTYKWLADAGIVPSNTTGVKLDDMLEVLTNRSGSIPFVRLPFVLRLDDDTDDSLDVVVLNGTSCRKFGITLILLDDPRMGESARLDVRLIGRIVIPLDTTRNSSCNATSPVWYYERTEGSEH